jgi:hypothetical protein
MRRRLTTWTVPLLHLASRARFCHCSLVDARNLSAFSFSNTFVRAVDKTQFLGKNFFFRFSE